jgi:hypothetical protein
MTLESVSERDVDLLLIEELKCSLRFRGWFLSRLASALERPPWRRLSSFQVRHSVSGIHKPAGETDVEVSFTAAGSRVLVLIENKLDAPFQSDQALRYARRAESLVKQNMCCEALTLLFAPSGYIGSAPSREEFNAVLSYEDVTEYLKKRSLVSGELGLRQRHRMELMEQAIWRWRRGYTAVPDAAMTKFWAEYYSLARAEAPLLKMERPGKKPLNSTWVSFNRAIHRLNGLPRCELLHKWSLGKVDLQFSRLAARYDAIAPVIEPMLEPGMTLRQAGKSLAVSMDVPVLDGTAEFGPQRPVAEQGLAAASRLRAWYNKNASGLAQALGPHGVDRASDGRS